MYTDSNIPDRLLNGLILDSARTSSYVVKDEVNENPV